MTADPTRRGFAKLLWRLADLIQAAEKRRSFRARAYRNAVWALDDIADIESPDEVLLSTPGIGPGVTALLHEYKSTGHIGQLIPLEEAYPLEAQSLRRLPRMSPRMLRDLKSLGVEDSKTLAAAIESGAVTTLKGVGPQTLDLWRRIIDLPPDQGVVPAYQAWVQASALSRHFSRHTEGDVHIGGAVRRAEEWVGRIDLVIAADDLRPVTSFVDVTASLGDTEASSAGVYRALTHSGIQVGIDICEPQRLGNALFTATDPTATSFLPASASDYSSERDLYESVGLSVIPPAARALPTDVAQHVVLVDDLRGDLHLHSEASPDGRMTLDAIFSDATARGYEHVLITDHTEGLRFGGLGEEEITAQASAIERLRSAFPALRVFHGAELNIGRDGELDLRDDALSTLDFAVAGVHSYFGLGRGEQTDRVLSALRHPVVKILAHPFGRRIGIRPPLAIDMEAVIEVAIAEDVALETNGHRDRLDLPSDWIGRAAKRGALFAANSDAHRLEEMANISNAVASIQRAGVAASQVINTWGASRLADWALTS